jgi:DegV family protein with EDD domain
MILNGSESAVAEPPSPEVMGQIYAELFRETSQILSLHSAPSVSQALQYARSASESFLGRCDIQVVDSQSLSAGLGLLVEAAVQAADRGESLDSILRLVRGMIPRLYVIFFLEDLTHLERYGLVSRSQAILGNMLGVIAFLTMEDGRLIPMEKVRSRARALEKLVEFVSEFTHLDHISILQPGQEKSEDSTWVAERLEGLHPQTPISFADYGPSLATLVGGNSLGVVVLESVDDPL